MAAPGPKPRPPINLESLGLGGAGLAAIASGSLVPEPRDGEMMPTAGFVTNLKAMAYFTFYKDNVGFGHLRPVDAPMIEKLCLTHVMLDRVVEEYCDGQLLGQTAALTDTISPYFQMFTKLIEIIRKMSAEMGLTPSERARIKLGAMGGLKGDAQKERNNLLAKHKLGAVRAQE